MRGFFCGPAATIGLQPLDRLDPTAAP